MKATPSPSSAQKTENWDPQKRTENKNPIQAKGQATWVINGSVMMVMAIAKDMNQETLEIKGIEQCFCFVLGFWGFWGLGLLVVARKA